MLDECANIAPLGDLPKLAAELGGLGITTAVILQSVASARTIWGEAGERALRDLANITLVWGGQKDVAFLEEISRLAGEHDELVETVTQNELGKSSSWTPRRMPVLPIGDIANLAPNHAVVVSPIFGHESRYLPSWRDDRILRALAVRPDRVDKLRPWLSAGRPRSRSVFLTGPSLSKWRRWCADARRPKSHQSGRRSTDGAGSLRPRSGRFKTEGDPVELACAGHVGQPPDPLRGRR